MSTLERTVRACPPWSPPGPALDLSRLAEGHDALAPPPPGDFTAHRAAWRAQMARHEAEVERLVKLAEGTDGGPPARLAAVELAPDVVDCRAVFESGRSQWSAMQAEHNAEVSRLV